MQGARTGSRSFDVAAVQLLVPALGAAQQAAADAAREAGDEKITVLDPPHVSLGYPWQAPPTEAEVRAVGARHLPLTVGLGTLDVFGPDTQGRRTLHVPVLDGGVLQELATQLGWVGPVTPHCSLVRSDSEDALARAREAAVPLVPAVVTLTTIEVTMRTAGTWAQAVEWHVQDADAPEEVTPPDGT